METVPYPALKKIIKELSYDDIISLSHTPDMRDIMRDYFSYEPHFKKLEKNIILDCIKKLEDDLETNFFFELYEFFEERGFVDVGKLLQSKMITFKYFDDLMSLCDKTSSSKNSLLCEEVETLKNNLKVEFDIPFDFIFKIKGSSINKVIKDRTKKYDEDILSIQKKHIDQFLKNLFDGKDGYENVMSYLEVIEDYVKNYITDKNYKPLIKEFRNCMESKLLKIKKIFRYKKE